MRRSRQDARIAGRAEAIQRFGRDLPDSPAVRISSGFQRGKHMGGITVKMDVHMHSLVGAGPQRCSARR